MRYGRRLMWGDRTTVRIVDPAEIRTGHLLPASYKRYIRKRNKERDRG